MSLLCVLGGAGTLAYRYDPGEQFHKPGSRAVARALLAGRSVHYAKNLDLRLVLRVLAERAPVPDVAVFGSSVTANAGAGLLEGGGSLLNLSVNGGTLVDAVGLMDVYERRGRWPRRIVLWLDGASFDPALRDLRWWSLAAGIAHLGGKLGEEVALPPRQGRLEELRQLLSWSYGVEAARAWLRDGGFQHARSVPEGLRDRVRVMRPDGSRSWGDFDPDAASVARRARRAVERGHVQRLAAFAEVGLRDSARLRLLHSLLHHLDRRGVEVTLLTTPLAPAAYRLLTESAGGEDAIEALAELDRALAQAAREGGARIVGSSLPRGPGHRCGDSGHLDLHHLRDACLARYLTAALEEAPRRIAEHAAGLGLSPPRRGAAPAP